MTHLIALLNGCTLFEGQHLILINTLRFHKQMKED
ncbi:hypothetical protein D0N43_05905 [Klebsiella aerogenes]|uniref:Uncharacterized protein n=1 Tax=Klebsiella aerogenes (strain ATCC 13048 / DSM 30053 / CCUG 1429 / JCM 1235 / KCTC 2190 / NBRC 13534 / NCIMB 10102 / NCTC 10006 / CDC 819-56) TaxID=1028307 RepID=A0A0H3FJC9_KLEAK|nr:hypothetical protein EAE_02765 [Klebsiella aerogenes KCTC 2190]QEU21590.1 hypothetical protein FOB49_24460 [Klebsiella aerogenes]RFP75139.1 hypothetical protein D0N43_05905 [Klebsiella aerogenes]VDZ67793.1 Uncharacterised protein [Klebsiella aerogenes]